MIQIRFNFKYEDRFNIAWRDFLSRKPHGVYNQIQILEIEEFADSNERYISWVFKYQGKMLNELFDFLDDVENIMAIDIQFRYVSSITQAYDADKRLYCRKWFKFAN